MLFVVELCPNHLYLKGITKTICLQFQRLFTRKHIWLSEPRTLGTLASIFDISQKYCIRIFWKYKGMWSSKPKQEGGKPMSYILSHNWLLKIQKCSANTYELWSMTVGYQTWRKLSKRDTHLQYEQFLFAKQTYKLKIYLLTKRARK